MSWLQFTAWCSGLLYIFIFPFSLLQLKLPWQKKESSISQIPPVPTFILTDRHPLPNGRDWNIQRSTLENGRWVIEFWEADNLKLIRKEYSNGIDGEL